MPTVRDSLSLSCVPHGKQYSNQNADLCAQGVAFCEAHEDLEVFRLRFGKAINFEYMEDSQVRQ
jgi:hypothetical protein